jgi:phosphoglycerate dehydrogenase-like enzyme
MRPHVWIPERAPTTERTRLAGIADVHDFAAEGPIPTVVGRGEILVAADDTDRAFAVAAHIEGLRVIQAFSAGVDSLIGRVPPGIVLCDAAGVHDVAVAE